MSSMLQYILYFPHHIACGIYCCFSGKLPCCIVNKKQSCAFGDTRTICIVYFRRNLLTLILTSKVSREFFLCNGFVEPLMKGLCNSASQRNMKDPNSHCASPSKAKLHQLFQVIAYACSHLFGAQTSLLKPFNLKSVRKLFSKLKPK